MIKRYRTIEVKIDNKVFNFPKCYFIQDRNGYIFPVPVLTEEEAKLICTWLHENEQLEIEQKRVDKNNRWDINEP